VYQYLWIGYHNLQKYVFTLTTSSYYTEQILLTHRFFSLWWCFNNYFIFLKNRTFIYQVTSYIGINKLTSSIIPSTLAVLRYNTRNNSNPIKNMQVTLTLFHFLPFRKNDVSYKDTCIYTTFIFCTCLLTVSPSTGSILTSDGDNIALESGDTPLWTTQLYNTHLLVLYKYTCGSLWVFHLEETLVEFFLLHLVYSCAYLCRVCLWS